MFGDTRWHLFTFRGHGVYMTPLFLIMLAVLAFAGVNNSSQLLTGVLFAFVAFVSILLHEFGHAAMSKRFGWGPSTILFWGMGGLAISQRPGRRDPKKDIAVSLAGPAVNLVLAGIAFPLLYVLEGGMAAGTLVGEFVRLMFALNLFWAIFNLLPIYPMDGGQALQKALEIRLKDRAEAAKYTGITGIVTIALSVLGFGVLGQFFSGPFMIVLGLYFAYLNYKLIESRGRELRWY